MGSQRARHDWVTRHHDEPNIPGSYEIFFFTSSDFTNQTYSQLSVFQLCSSSFILYGAIRIALCFSPVTFWTPFSLGCLSVSYPFAFLYCSWDICGKNTGVGCHSFLQEIFPIQGSDPGLLYCREILYHLSHQGSPLECYWCIFLWYQLSFLWT